MKTIFYHRRCPTILDISIIRLNYKDISVEYWIHISSAQSWTAVVRMFWEDVCIVRFLPMLMPKSEDGKAAGPDLSMLRTFRVLRPLKLVSGVPSKQIMQFYQYNMVLFIKCILRLSAKETLLWIMIDPKPNCLNHSKFHFRYILYSRLISLVVIKENTDWQTTSISSPLFCLVFLMFDRSSGCDVLNC